MHRDDGKSNQSASCSVQQRLLLCRFTMGPDKFSTNVPYFFSALFFNYSHETLQNKIEETIVYLQNIVTKAKILLESLARFNWDR